MALPREQWHTLLLDRHPGYISWAEYEANLRRLHENAQANGAERLKSPPREGPALLQGLVVCGRCGQRMGVRYHTIHGELVPEYVCQRRAIDEARPLCARIVGHEIDRAVGELLIEVVSPLALEVALTIEAELAARAAEADVLRRAQVDRARYEAELAQRRYLRVDPDNRLVADSLEADWNAKLRALASAQDAYEREREADGHVLTEERRREVLALATDFPRLWRDAETPQRERKRMIRLLIEDVTLLRTDAVVAHVRFRGGATRTLSLPPPRSAAELRKTDPAVIAEIDRLLDEHADAEIVAILNERGLRPGVGERFSLSSLHHLRRRYGLADHGSRLRGRGLLTLDEMADLLGADRDTVKKWARVGRLASRIVNDKGQRLFERPAALQWACRWCGGPIPAKPALRGGKKWCSQRCCMAAYNARKRAARVAQHQSVADVGQGFAIDRAEEVQSVA